jgi:hypothetical protein
VVAFDRVARCHWLPDAAGSSTPDKRIVAHLVRSFRTDPFPGIDSDTELNRLGHPIAFTARPFGGTAVTDVREQLYTGLAAGTGDGIGFTPDQPDFGFAFFGSGGALNDFLFTGGKLIAGGQPASLPDEAFVYSQQPWTDPGKANADGVPVIAPLTTPTADRIDVMYADVWDGANRREIAVRVREANLTPPPEPLGHKHMPLALLHRPAGAARIEFDHVEDRRTQFNQTRSKLLRLPPLFLPVPGEKSWEMKFTANGFAAKKGTGDSALGMLPLALPEGALLSSLRVSGDCLIANSSQGVFFSLHSTGPQPTPNVLLQDSVKTPGKWTRTLTLPRRVRLDAQSFSCFLSLWGDSGAAAEIYEMTIGYDY